LSAALLGVAAFGALGGGVAAALAARAVPTLATRLMSEMKRRMMAEMCGGGWHAATSGGCGVRCDCEGSDEQPESAAAMPSECGCGATQTAEAASEPQVV